MFCSKQAMLGLSKSISGFDPRSIPGCALWLDGADPLAGALPSNGATVSTWYDKSGNGYNAPATVSGATFTAASQNGNGYITFPTGKYFTTSNFILSSTNTPTIFLVCQQTGYGSGNSDIISASTGTPYSYYTLDIYGNSGTKNLAVNMWSNVNVNGNISIANPTVISIVGSGSPTYSVTMWGNGTSNVTFTGYASNPLSTSNSFWIGAISAGFIGNIYEVLFYDTAFTSSQRQSVEGYLAWKWGIKSSLSATHPFYSTPAFSRPFGPTDIPGCALWLDAADSSTMNSTTTVTSWTDKSGLGNTMTGTATVSGSNMTFNGSTQAFSNTTFVFPSSNYSMFAVYSNTTAPASTAYMNVVYGSGGYPMLGVYGSSKFVSARSVVANTGALSPNVAASSTVLVSATYTPSTFSPFINGSTETTLAGTTLAATGIYVGGPTNYFNGSISEILVYSSNLSTSQRQQVEGYLAAKWGLLSSVVSGHPFKSIPPSTSQPPQFQEVTPGNWTYDWQPYLQRLAAANSSGVTVTTSNIAGAATYTDYGWVGGVLAPNGNIYFAPLNALNILVYNPTTGTTSNLTGGATYVANGWTGGVLAPNGNIYFTPKGANSSANILVLNPTTGVTSNLTGGATYLTNGWGGGVLAPNGNIYCAPLYASNVLVINPTTQVTSNLTGGATYVGNGWYGGVLAPNGNIYFAPWDASNILVLNPTTGVTSNLTGGASYTGTAKWYGGVLAPNGNIYFAPVLASNILVLNPTTGVTSNLTGGATYTGKELQSGVLAPNGNIYFIPINGGSVLVLNPTTGVTSNLTGGATYTTGGWAGGVLGLDGNIYCAPVLAKNVLKINFAGLSQLPSSNYCLSAWTNKF